MSLPQVGRHLDNGYTVFVSMFTRVRTYAHAGMCVCVYLCLSLAFFVTSGGKKTGIRLLTMGRYVIQKRVICCFVYVYFLLHLYVILYHYFYF